MEPTAILSFGVSKLPPKLASLAAHPADVGLMNKKHKMTKSDWDHFDKQMLRWSSHLSKDVKIVEGHTNKIASIIAQEIDAISIESKRQIIDRISEPISIQDRFDELVAFQGWMDIACNLRDPYVTRAQVVVQNYMCFVYLGESCFKILKQYVVPGGVAKKCCNFLINNPVRSFRNAIAHSNWKYSDDFSSIIYYAKKGHLASEPMTKWEVSQNDLAFWQALARCTAYVAFSILK
jgi:hypothetical protein